MSELKILLKNNFNIMLGSLQGKKNRKSNISMFLLLLLGAIGLLSLYSLQAWSMFDGLGSLGLQDVCLFHGLTTALTVMVIIGVMRVAGKTKGSDTELLLSLPLKKINIILSKIVNKYFFDLIFSIILLLPYIVIYQIYSGFSIYITLMGCLVILMLPLLSVGISYICDFIISRLFNKLFAINL